MESRLQPEGLALSLRIVRLRPRPYPRYLVHESQKPAACSAAGWGVSVAGEYQHLYWHQERLHSQDDGVDHTNRIHHVQEQRFTKAKLTFLEQLVIIGLGIGDAFAPWHDFAQSAFVKRFHHNSQCAGACSLLRVKQDVSRFELPSSDDWLHARYHHRNHREGLGHADHFSDCARLDDLR